MAAIRLLYFARIRDAVGREEESLDFGGPHLMRTVRDLRELLESTRPELRGQLNDVRFAVNESFATMDAELQDGDVVAIIPPVSGG